MTESSFSLSIRIDLGEDRRIGPGKILLLERIAALGSISAAGRDLGMSYRRAWELVEELNLIFGRPVVASRSGGKQGGGATLTALGESLVARYRSIEKAAASATAEEVASLAAELTAKRS